MYHYEKNNDKNEDGYVIKYITRTCNKGYKGKSIHVSKKRNIATKELEWSLITFDENNKNSRPSPSYWWRLLKDEHAKYIAAKSE